MGLRSKDGKAQVPLPTFTENILKIEKSGPNEDHLTVIDVPGIFRDTEPGELCSDNPTGDYWMLTSNTGHNGSRHGIGQQDGQELHERLQNYVRASHVFPVRELPLMSCSILAVMDCTRDIATQDVLKLAKEADPDGLRTLGVFTKPDLATERAVQRLVIDRVLAKNPHLKLGYCVVKNRGADDLQSTLQQRHQREKAFFQQDPWSILDKTGRAGIGALGLRLRELLQAVTKREFPEVKNDIKLRLRKDQEQLQELGTSRADAHAQRAYLAKLSTTWQSIAFCALEAHYVRDQIFTQNPQMRLVTRVIDLNEAFAHGFWRRGHKWKFMSLSGLDGDDEDECRELTFQHSTYIPIPVDSYPELQSIIHHDPEYSSEPPLPHVLSLSGKQAERASLMDYIKHAYRGSRGPELRTVSAMLRTHHL